MHLSAVDLDLLVVLHALVETQSVRQAAQRLSLSRSATSHALGRLRDLFDDPLLVRTGRRLALTPRAERLRPALAQWIGDTERLLTDAGTFDPLTAGRAFRVGTNDYAERVLLAPLGRQMAGTATGVDLFSHRVGNGVDELRSGAVDLMLGAATARPADVVVEPLYEDRHVCLLRADHPALDAPLTPERFAALHHVLVAPGGTPTGVMDARLASVGLSRRVARTVATFSVAPELLVGTDFVLTMAERLARPMAARLGLVVVDAPFDVRFPIGMAWHRRTDLDPAHQWLRDQVRNAAAEPP